MSTLQRFRWKQSTCNEMDYSATLLLQHPWGLISLIPCWFKWLTFAYLAHASGAWRLDTQFLYVQTLVSNIVLSWFSHDSGFLSVQRWTNSQSAEQRFIWTAWSPDDYITLNSGITFVLIACCKTDTSFYALVHCSYEQLLIHFRKRVAPITDEYL